MDNGAKLKLNMELNLRFLFSLGLASAMSVVTAQSMANTDFLPPDQAFQLSAESLDTKTAQLQWKIAPDYYLYHDQFKVSINQQPLKLDLPAGKAKDDPTFGLTDVHYNQVTAKFQVKPNSQYLVMWQGCAEDGLCYPMQRKTIKTDADGLLPQLAQGANKTLLGQNQSSGTPQAAVTSAPQNSNTTNATNTTANNSQQNSPQQTNTLTTTAPSTASTAAQASAPLESANAEAATALPADPDALSASNAGLDATTDATTDAEGATSAAGTTSSSSSSSQLQINNDQGFFQLLSVDSLALNLVIFFLLGVLLAFLPCSLPLIPILSGIIVQRASGYKAVAVALSFVISMALVYSIMGIVVAEIGYSFQRWFQSPLVIGLFALIFVALALNLFGLYQISMPQKMMAALDRLQNKQKGGTLIGAIVMGALSALIVGPCMSAPLAGALLFVSQSQSAVLGGIYLFILGLGLGLPLFIASVFGAKYLPKPGMWMDRIKVGFGFVMLMVAVYFIRPMIPSTLYYALLAVLCLVLMFYLIKIRRGNTHKVASASLIVLAALSLIAGIWNIQNSVQAYQVQHSSEELLSWRKVTTAEELQLAMDEAKQQQRPILIDVYADWCTACQPIEKEVLPRTDVQAALAGRSLIKLDLTDYEESQDLVLKQHQILGPPTLLLLDADGQEQRDLRLTGTFSATQLLKQLQQHGQ